MNHSLLIPCASPLIPCRSSPSRQLHFSRSQFINPPALLRSPISVIRTEDVAQQGNPIYSGVFGPKKKLRGIQLLAEALSSPPVRIASSVAIVAGALAGGYGLGRTLNFGFSGAVALGAAGGAAIQALNSCVSEVAAVNLHNFVASCDDPESLKREDIEAISKKYGVSEQDEAFNAELHNLYRQFVFSVYPPRIENLRGNERETVMEFSNALGILDPNAAVADMKIGQHYLRQFIMEMDDRDDGIEQYQDVGIEQCQPRVVRDANAIASGDFRFELHEVRASVKIAANGSRLTEEAAIAIAIKARVLLDIYWILYL
ncbi:hypothetical protein NE237_023383 [Protea cynaroides]|uniref:Uncharacterized protein n=1 Tax=Protea cynaroides TaxID=273540 RepID=A0A9Q0HH12_9MAGN|nr:hypothetical protein NE237_023383 [Protea cynaroides]